MVTQDLQDNSEWNVNEGQRPQFLYRAPWFDPAKKYSVALVPFLNVNARNKQ